MLNNINSDEYILNNAAIRQNNVTGVDKNAASKNPYLKVVHDTDVADISDQAKQLYQKEQEVSKYKSMVMDSLNTPATSEQTNTILDSIKTGGYISNDQLAEKMLKGDITLSSSELISISMSHPDTEGV